MKKFFSDCWETSVHVVSAPSWGQSFLNWGWASNRQPRVRLSLLMRFTLWFAIIYAILDANGMSRSVNMSAMEGPDFYQPQVRNFSNICNFNLRTRCNSVAAQRSVTRLYTHSDQLYSTSSVRLGCIPCDVWWLKRHKKGMIASNQLSTRWFDLRYVVCRVVHAWDTDASLRSRF